MRGVKLRHSLPLMRAVEVRYVFLFIVLSSCWQPETVENQVLDASAYDIWLTIDPRLKTVKLGSTIDGTPKNYPLQLHAFISRARPLAKDQAGIFLPFVVEYVVFSYWREQPQLAVYTCVEKNVAISVPHKLDVARCNEGEDVLQTVRACVDDTEKRFEIDKEQQKNLSCVAASP